jgi:hypothetical protein
MEKSNPPFQAMSDMVQTSFEQTRKAMEQYLGLFK